MSNEPPPPDDFEKFSELILPDYASAIVAAWAETGRPLSPAEVEEILLRVLADRAGDAFREIYGADVVAAVFDGKKPS
jgi:hypothetical protein